MITRLARARSLLVCVLAFGPSVFSSLAVAAPQYTITPFAVGGTSGSAVTDLNDLGVAVGFTLDNTSIAFRSDGVTVTSLDPLTPGKSAFANGISNNGTIVGQAKNSSVPSQTRSVMFGSPTVELIPGSAFSFAEGVNDAGQITGGYGSSSSNAQAFLLTNGSVQNLGVLPGKSISFGEAINSSGQVAGRSTGSQASANRGFVWTSGVGMTDLGLPAGEASAAVAGVEAINDQGWITGQWQRYVGGTPQARRGFVYRNGVMEDLVPTYGFTDAFDINNLGQIVGDASLTTTSDIFGFLWDNGTVYNLNDLIDPASGWELFGATAINNLGQIVGDGRYQGQFVNYILTPIVTPVPGAVWLFGSGLLGLVGLARRRRT